MRKNMDWAPEPDVRVLGVERDGDCWVISAVGPEVGSCPRCRAPSTRRHSRYFRHLQDLPMQGAAVVVKMQVSRWRCLNRECERETFTDQLPEIVYLHARRIQRIAELVQLLSATALWPVGRTADETSRHASQRRRHSAASERQVARLRARTTGPQGVCVSVTQ
jgi:transposase